MTGSELVKRLLAACSSQWQCIQTDGSTLRSPTGQCAGAAVAVDLH